MCICIHMYIHMYVYKYGKHDADSSSQNPYFKQLPWRRGQLEKVLDNKDPKGCLRLL